MTARKRTDLIVVHVTATPPDRDIGVVEVRKMHLARGFSDIGYGGLLRRSGAREIGRGLDQIGAHVAGFNSISLGIAMVGGIDSAGRARDNASPEQWTGLEAWLRELVVQFPGAKICGHRDLSPDRNGNGIIEAGEHIKECPCFDAIPWAASKGLPAVDIRGNWGDVLSVPAANDAVATKVMGPDARLVYLQKLLSLSGLQFGPIDGIVGNRTAAAIKLYQEWNGLPQSGTFDDATVKLLRSTFEKKAAA